MTMKTTAVSILKIQRLALKSAADGIGKCSTWGSLYELIKQKIFSNYGVGAGAALFQRQTLHFFIDKHSLKIINLCKFFESIVDFECFVKV